jgi:hypothetical protein
MCFHDTSQRHGTPRMWHGIYKISHQMVQNGSNIHVAKISSHTSKPSYAKCPIICNIQQKSTHYKRDVKEHKGPYCIPSAHTHQVQYMSQPTLSYFIRIAYFNTTYTTKTKANTNNIATFMQPHTRQMQLAVAPSFLTTISFTMFCRVSIFSTSSGTSVVESAAMVYWLTTMVVDDHYHKGTPHILPRTNS